MTRKGWILFIAMSVIWGIPYLFIKIALLELTPGWHGSLVCSPGKLPSTRPPGRRLARRGCAPQAANGSRPGGKARAADRLATRLAAAVAPVR